MPWATALRTSCKSARMDSAEDVRIEPDLTASALEDHRLALRLRNVPDGSFERGEERARGDQAHLLGRVAHLTQLRVQLSKPAEKPCSSPLSTVWSSCASEWVFAAATAPPGRRPSRARGAPSCSTRRPDQVLGVLDRAPVSTQRTELDGRLRAIASSSPSFSATLALTVRNASSGAERPCGTATSAACGEARARPGHRSRRGASAERRRDRAAPSRQIHGMGRERLLYRVRQVRYLALLDTRAAPLSVCATGGGAALGARRLFSSSRDPGRAALRARLPRSGSTCTDRRAMLLRVVSSGVPAAAAHSTASRAARLSAGSDSCSPRSLRHLRDVADGHVDLLDRGGLLLGRQLDLAGGLVVLATQLAICLRAAERRRTACAPASTAFDPLSVAMTVVLTAARTSSISARDLLGRTAVRGRRACGSRRPRPRSACRRRPRRRPRWWR